MAFFKDCPMKMQIWFLCVVDSASTLVHIAYFIKWLSIQALKVTDELRNMHKQNVF